MLVRSSLLLFLFTLAHAVPMNLDKTTVRKVPLERQVHGMTLTDDYAWMRDPNWPEVSSKEVLEFLEAENKATEAYLNKWSAKRIELLEELKGRIAQFDESPPVRLGEFLYWTRFEAGREHPSMFRRRNLDGSKEELVLDVNLLADGKEFTRMREGVPSPDNRYFAYSVDYSGKEKYEIHIIDLHSGRLLEDSITGSRGGVVWHEELPGFFYVKFNDKSRPDRIFFHELGSSEESDRLVFFEPDERFSLALCKSSSREYIFLTSHGHSSNELRCIQSSSLDMKPQLIRPKEDGIFYDVAHHGLHFYIRINDKGGNFRLARQAVDGSSALLDFIKCDPKLYLASFDLSSKYIVLNYKKMGVPLVRVLSFEGKLQEVDFPDEAYSASAFCANFQDEDLRVCYSSLAVPNTIFSYNFPNNRLDVLKRREIPSGFNPSEYSVKRLEAERDGVKIPITVLTKREFKLGSGAPLYITAYGAYGGPAYIGFSSFAISLVNRGFAFAVAHVRGGDELGLAWYEGGKFLSKKNTFEDFIACTEFLVEKGFGSKGNIVLSGGSAGGMLVGSVINSRPEMYKCAIALVPFVDVLNTMLDPDLPLTKPEYEEWGDPNQKEHFDYIKSYCPYSNVKRQKYPHVFATAGLADFRVGYWESAKWVAKLREFNTGKSLIMLRTQMDSGHQGASGRFKQLGEFADELVFVFSLTLPGF